MAEDDKTDDFERILRIMNKGHGYAGIFNSDNSDEKLTVEKSTVEEWRASIKAEYGIEIDATLRNPDDLPDFFVSIGGRRLGVELVQLVDREHKQRAAKGETPYAGQLFVDMQWSGERLIAKLHEIITHKGKKYEKAGIDIDVLLIHTAEIWLTSIEARSWLNGVRIDAHPSIRAVSLLFDYEPGTGLYHWPEVPVYGELAQIFSSD